MLGHSKVFPLNVRTFQFVSLILLSSLMIWVWNATPSMALEEVPWRIVFSGIYVFILPGLLMGQVMSVRSESIFETIAISTLLSFALGLAASWIVVVSRLTIREWCWFFVVWNLVWTVMLLWPREILKESFFRSFSSLVFFRSPFLDYVLALVVALLAVALYRWADKPTTVYWEVGNLLTYIRNYSSGLTLGVDELGLRPGIFLPNQFFLWEFMMAGGTHFSGQDPLLAATRMRWIIPVLAFSCFYFFLRHVLDHSRKAMAVLFISIVLVLGRVMFLTPDPIKISMILMEKSRLLFSFMGSIHHSDAGGDILLPVVTGILFMYFNQGCRRALWAIPITLFIAFYFHPRVYFQVMWYGLLWASVLLATSPSRELKPFLRRTVIVAGVFVLSSILLMIMTKVFAAVPVASGTQVVLDTEIDKKLAYINDFIVSGWRPPYWENPFNFSSHSAGYPVPPTPQVYSFMVLSTLALPIIAYYGTLRERQLALFFVILWILSITFIPAQKIFTILTYSEMLVVKVRVLPLFGYVIISLGIMHSVNAVGRKWSVNCRVPHWQGNLLAALCFGVGIAFLWRLDAPQFIFIRYAFPLILIVSFLSLAASFWGRPLKFRFKAFDTLPLIYQRQTRDAPFSWGVLLSAVIFVLPLGYREGSKLMHSLLTFYTDVEAGATTRNHSGLPAETILFLKEGLAPRQLIQVRPLSSHMIGVYAPQYSIPSPKGQIHADINQIQMEVLGKHFLYNPQTKSGEGNPQEIRDYLLERHIPFMLVGKEFYEGYKIIAQRGMGDLEVVHEVAGKSLILQVRPER